VNFLVVCFASYLFYNEEVEVYEVPLKYSHLV